VAALRRFADPAQRAAWAAVPKRPRSARAMALELERAYCEVLVAAGRRLPPLRYEPGTEQRRARGPLAWLARLFRAGQREGESAPEKATRSQ
jgi:hypothetical protein